MYARSGCRLQIAAGCFAAGALFIAERAIAAEFGAALTGGKIDLAMRYRYESVDDDQRPALSDAHAHTLRTALGYETGNFRGMSAAFQLEDVRTLGRERFNDGGSNGRAGYALVVDPQDTEVQQAKLGYHGAAATHLWLGRQEIEHRQAPMHRYVGTIPWRQNWQSFDGVRLLNETVPYTAVDYAYVWNVNRIFGEDNPLPDRADQSLAGHLMKVNYSGIPCSTFEPFAYMLDFDNRLAANRALSIATVGGRLQGSCALAGAAATLSYAAEYAHQQDYGDDNPIDLAVGYALVELGASKSFAQSWLESVTLKLSYERLGGDGVVMSGGAPIARAFQTPLGTNHAFQGWADRFLITPPDGVVDRHATFAARIFGANFAVVFHDFDAERDGYGYGSEWDAQLSRVLLGHYTVGLKYACYEADDNPRNLARNGAASSGKQAFDLHKLWVWAELRF